MALFDFPRWKLTSPAAESGVVAPDERLSAGQTLVMGVQHAVAIVEMIHDTLGCLSMICSENRLPLFRIMLPKLVAEQRIEDEGPFIATGRGRRRIRAIGRIEHAGLCRPLALGIARCGAETPSTMMAHPEGVRRFLLVTTNSPIWGAPYKHWRALARGGGR